jgi:hypothetical protein
MPFLFFSFSLSLSFSKLKAANSHKHYALASKAGKLERGSVFVKPKQSQQ